MGCKDFGEFFGRGAGHFGSSPLMFTNADDANDRGKNRGMFTNI